MKKDNWKVILKCIHVSPLFMHYQMVNFRYPLQKPVYLVAITRLQLLVKVYLSNNTQHETKNEAKNEFKMTCKIRNNLFHRSLSLTRMYITSSTLFQPIHITWKQKTSAFLIFSGYTAFGNSILRLYCSKQSYFQQK